MTTATAVAAPTEAKPKRVKKEVREIIHLVDNDLMVLDCNLCEKLCASRTTIVNGRGPKHARIAIIGEAPSEFEDERGVPFAGAVGVTLNNWLRKVGLDPDRDVYYGNAIKCHPEGKRKPSAKEIRNCNAHIWADLERIQPDVIIAAGNSALEALLPANIAAEGITKTRGHIFWNERMQRKIIPMFNPSSVFHDFGQELFCIADLRKAVRESENPTEMPKGLGEYIPLLTVEAVEEACTRFEKSNLLVFDTETTHSAKLTCEQAGNKGGLDWQTAQVLCIGMTDTVGKAWVFPLVGKNFRQIWTPSEYKRVMKAIRHLFLSDVPKIAQNGKFDVHMMREAGIVINEFLFDTMLAYSFIHESASHALEPMRSMFTSMPFYDADVYDETEGKSHMERAEEDVLWKYCGADVDCTLRVAKEIDKLLDEEGEDVRWILENITMPAQAVATHIEERGVLIDMQLANHVIEETDRMIAQTEKELFSALPAEWQDLNYKSPQQMKKLLYVDLELALPPVLTDTGAQCKVCRVRENQHWYHTSTNKDAIKMLEGGHPVIQPLQVITQLVTLKKMFLLGEEGRGSGLLHHVREDGRIHTSYRCGDVETGRWSSSPNLQNIPKETDERPEIYHYIRRLFVAPEGRKLVECDFSQIELRILSYLAGEHDMVKRFEANEDFHLYTARHILWPEVDPEMADSEWKEKHDDKRTGAKRVNFGIPYGLTSFGMSQWLHCSEQEAAQHISDYFGFFTHVRDYFRHSDRDLNRRGLRLNGFGRRRHFYGIESMQHYGGYKKMLGHMRREAYNYPIQSTAADVLSLAMVYLDNDPWFEEHDCFIVLTVHDSVTLEAPDELARECGHRVLAHFEAAGRELVYKNEEGEEKPYYLPGEGKIGKRWSDWDATITVDGKYIEKEKKAA